MALSADKLAFLKEFYTKASTICPKYNLVAIEAITAQAMCESAWNTSSLSSKYHNYFGMKCGSSWKGTSVNMATKEEYKAGVITNISANFRTYSSMEEGIKGYCEFITGMSRYKNLLGVTDGASYIHYIKADGWATDSKYVTTLTNIMNTYVIPNCKTSTSNPTSTAKSTTSASKPSILYRVYQNGKWSAESKNSVACGTDGKSIKAVMMKLSDGSAIKYRTHKKGGAWLPWVTGYSTTNASNGYAGDLKTDVDAIEIKCAKYDIRYNASIISSVKFVGEVKDNVSSGSNAYAGILGTAMDKITIRVV